MTENKYAARIQALLDKAESTNSEAEAQALTAKAAELVTKYGIEQAELDAIREASGQGKGSIIESRMWFGGTYCHGLMLGAYQILMAFGGALQATRSRSPHRDYLGIAPEGDTRRGLYLTIYGYESDIEQAKVLISSVLLQSVSAARRWWREQNADWYASPMIARRSYIEGYFSGAADKIAASRTKVVSEASESGALALIDRAEEVKRSFDERYAGARNTRGHSRNGWAATAGRRDGANADVGSSRVANRAALA